MDRFTFTSDPAWVTVGEGLSLAFRHWRSTWWLWCLPAIAVVLIALISNVVLRAGVDAIPAAVLDTATDDVDWGATLEAVGPPVVVAMVAVTLAGIAAQCVYLAAAIGGLRGIEPATGWIVRAGLRLLIGSLLLTAVSAIIALPIVALVRGGGAGLLPLAAIVVVPVLWYGSARLAFWSYALFDGAGIVESLAVSWRITRGAVLRVIGWMLAVAGISIGFSVALIIVQVPLGAAGPFQTAVMSAVETAVQQGLAVYQVLVLAVLYESQRRRGMPDVGPAPSRSDPAWTMPPAGAPWPGSETAAAAPTRSIGPDGPPPGDPWHPWRG